MSFKAQFALRICFKKQVNTFFFFSIFQRKGESLKSYTPRFNKGAIEILGCNGYVAVEAF